MGAYKWANRSKFEMAGEFLAFCRKPRMKTEIMEHVSLKAKDVRETIVTTMVVGLLRAFDTVDVRSLQYETTKKGNKYVDQYLKVKAMLEDTGESRNP